MFVCVCAFALVCVCVCSCVCVSLFVCVVLLCVRVLLCVCMCLCVQIRRALLQLLFPEKPFHWARHVAIAVCLLFCVNLLVILVPNIRDIFGIIGTA